MKIKRHNVLCIILHDVQLLSHLGLASQRCNQGDNGLLFHFSSLRTWGGGGDDKLEVGFLLNEHFNDVALRFYQYNVTSLHLQG